MRNAMKFALSVVFLLICSPAMAKTYYLSGPKYTEVSGPYTTSMRVVGFIETSAPLPANSPFSDIRGSIVAYSFSDGVVTLNQNNSQLCSFDVGTNGAGNPSFGWTTINAVPGGIGANAMDLGFGQYVFDPMDPIAAMTSVGTFTEANPVCTNNIYNGDENYAEAQDGLMATSNAEPIPALGMWGLLLLIMTMAGFGVISMSRQWIVLKR